MIQSLQSAGRNQVESVLRLTSYRKFGMNATVLVQSMGQRQSANFFRQTIGYEPVKKLLGAGS